jgi:hypothetical protein
MGREENAFNQEIWEEGRNDNPFTLLYTHTKMTITLALRVGMSCKYSYVSRLRTPLAIKQLWEL